ncbi:MAG TPA: phosphatase PAP2 family protein [Thermodesulfobacteriota bacterium]|nr:phosphatase PAP2 family protein [Thermodesulfobacteriota bacterium]
MIHYLLSFQFSQKIIFLGYKSSLVRFMASLLQSADATLFQLINRGGQNLFFDWLMPFMTDLKNFTCVLLALGIWILIREKKAGFIFLVFIGLTLGITDQFSSHLLKEWIGRIRPCSVLPNVRLLTDCNSSYSFPSSHAVNIFAAAFFLSQPFRRFTPLFYGIAAVVAYSRVYIGIHYPLDVIGGAGIGLLIAWPMRWLKDEVVMRFSPSPHLENRKNLLGHR